MIWFGFCKILIILALIFRANQLPAVWWCPGSLSANHWWCSPCRTASDTHSPAESSAAHRHNNTSVTHLWWPLTNTINEIPFIYRYWMGHSLWLTMLYLQNILLGWLVLSRPARRGSSQLYSVFWNNLWGFTLKTKSSQISGSGIMKPGCLVSDWSQSVCKVFLTAFPDGADLGSLWKVRMPPWRTVQDWLQFFLWSKTNTVRTWWENSTLYTQKSKD